MHVCLKRHWWRLTSLAALLVVLTAPGRAHAQKIDLNGNGMSDIWELIYGASGLASSSDADGDGVSNGLESIAGTNPFDSNSVPRISAITQSSTNFTVSMACAWGKQYELQSALD
jgi:hypothetical protein